MFLLLLLLHTNAKQPTLPLQWPQFWLKVHHPTIQFRLYQCFSKWANDHPWGHTEFLRESDRKLQDNSNFWAGHWKFTALIKYFKFKIETNVSFSQAFPTEQKTKLNFIAFPTSSLDESGWVTYWQSQVHNCLSATRRDDLCLSLAIPQPDIQKLASIYQAQGTHWT